MTQCTSQSKWLKANVWIAPKDDFGRATQTTSGAGKYFDLSTTPDGKILYASDAEGNAQIWEMEADGTGQKQLTSGAGRNYGPAASPDRRYILFHSNRSDSIAGPWNIWRMDRDGGNQKQLTSGDGEKNFAQCSPDGKWVVYPPIVPREGCRY